MRAPNVSTTLYPLRVDWWPLLCGIGVSRAVSQSLLGHRAGVVHGKRWTLRLARTRWAIGLYVERADAVSDNGAHAVAGEPR